MKFYSKYPLTNAHCKFVQTEQSKGQPLTKIWGHLHNLDKNDPLYYSGEYNLFTRKWGQWKKSAPLQTSDYDLTKSSDQILMLTDLVNSSAIKAIDKVRCLEAIQRVQEREDVKNPPPSDVGTPYLPTKIQLTADLLVDLVCLNLWQSEIAEKLIGILTIKDRHALLSKFIPDILTLEHRDESWLDKRARLRSELAELTEPELRSIEIENENLGFPQIVEEHEDDK